MVRLCDVTLLMRCVEEHRTLLILKRSTRAVFVALHDGRPSYRQPTFLDRRTMAASTGMFPSSDLPAHPEDGTETQAGWGTKGNVEVGDARLEVRVKWMGSGAVVWYPYKCSSMSSNALIGHL